MAEFDVYFACCTPEGGVYHYRYSNGAFTLYSRLSCDCPMYLDIEEDRMHILLRAPWKESDHSGLLSYDIASDGRLENAGVMADTQGIVACHLTHMNGHRYVANYLSGSVYADHRYLDVHDGHGPNPMRQDAPHTHFIKPSPDGRYLLSTDLGQDMVYVYDKNLTKISAASVPAGHGVRHLAYSVDGNYVFAANELGCSVTVFAWNDGTLTPIETANSLLGQTEKDTSAAIRVRDHLIYVSQRGADVISVMEWKSGKLTLLGVYPCGGVSPRDILLVEDKLFCTNERSNSVSVLQINVTALTDTGIRLSMPAPLCVAVRKRVSVSEDQKMS